MSVISSDEIRRRILEEKLVENYIDLDVQIQPCGFDLTVRKVGKLHERGVVDFDNTRRHVPDILWLQPEEDIPWYLDPGTYMMVFNEQLNIPLDLMADSIFRSSLMRCGVFTGLGRWDPGYSGTGQSLLIVHNPYGLTLSKNARTTQVKFTRVEGVKQGYRGQYQNEGARGWPR